MILPKGGNMGLQDRDYWKERYDENLNARRSTQEASSIVFCKSIENSNLEKLVTADTFRN